MTRAAARPRRPRLLPAKDRGLVDPVPHQGPVQALCADPFGGWALSGGKDGLLRGFDAAKGHCFGEWFAHDGGVWAICALGPSLVATAGHDHTVKLWNVSKRTCTATLKGHEDFVYRLLALRGGSALASAGADRVIRVWDVEGRTCLRELVGHSRLVSAMVPVGNTLLLSASADQSLRLWDLEAGTCRRALLGHRQDVLALAVSADGARAASTSADGELRLWDLQSGECLGAAAAHDGSAECVRILQSGAILSAGWDGRVRWWGPSARPTRQVRAHHGAVRALESAPRGRFLFTGGLDGVVRVLELKSGRAVSRWAGPGAVTALAAIDPTTVLAGFASGDAVVLRLATPPRPKPKARPKGRKR